MAQSYLSRIILAILDGMTFQSIKSNNPNHLYDFKAECLSADRRESARQIDLTYFQGTGYELRGLETYRGYLDSYFRPRFTRVLKELKRQIQFENSSQINILDLGCGHGRPLHELLKYLEPLSLSQVHGMGVSLSDFPKLHTPLANEKYEILDFFAQQLPVPALSQNLIISIAGPQPRDSKEALKWIEEMTRVLAPGGHLFYQIDNPSLQLLKLHKGFTEFKTSLYRTSRAHSKVDILYAMRQCKR